MVTICRVFELERTPKCFPVYLPIGMQSSGSQLVKLWVYSDFLSLLRAHTTPRPTGIRASALDAFLIYPLAEMFFLSLYLLLEKSLLPFKAYFAQKTAL